MAVLNLPTVELVSTLRAAPSNGPTNSQDYNDSWTESLADFASLSGFINDIILPILNGLSKSMQPSNLTAPNGLEGRFIFSDTTDLTNLFFDSLNNEPNTIGDSFRILQGIVTATQSSIANLNVEVTALQTQLSSTNQNDVSQALQNFAASLSALTAQVNSNTQGLAAAIAKFQTNGVDNIVQQKLNLIAGTNVTLVSDGFGGVTIAATGGGGGGVVPRTTATISAGSLANNVSAVGSIALAPSISVIRINTNFAARVQLYSTAASRDTAPEPVRPPSIPPTPGTANGVIFDMVLTGISVVPLNFPCSPTIPGSNQDTISSNTFYWRVTNISGATHSISVILTYLPTEA